MSTVLSTCLWRKKKSVMGNTREAKGAPGCQNSTPSRRQLLPIHLVLFPFYAAKSAKRIKRDEHERHRWHFPPLSHLPALTVMELEILDPNYHLSLAGKCLLHVLRHLNSWTLSSPGSSLLSSFHPANPKPNPDSGWQTVVVTVSRPKLVWVSVEAWDSCILFSHDSIWK